MGLRLSFGVGPLRYSKSLSGRRRRKNEPGLSMLLGYLIVGIVIACAWLVWALVMLPTAGIAKLAHNDELCRRAIGSLKWKR